MVDVSELLLSVCYSACVEPRDGFRMTVEMHTFAGHFDSFGG